MVELINVLKYLSQPLVVEPTTLELFMDYLGSRVASEPRSEGTASGIRIGSVTSANGEEIGVMELSGVLTPRFNASSMCGASNFVSTNDAILNYLDLADKFDKILLHVDSQGGAAIGVMEFAEAIRNSSAYVVGFTDTVAASGGYWILSACDEVVATPSAVVGSIGVYSAVTKKESSTMKTHYFSAGAKKLYGAKDTPLSDAEASHFQTSVDRMYEQFTSAVALNRGLPVEAIKATEAGTFAASEVVGLLVDRIVNNITEV